MNTQVVQNILAHDDASPSWKKAMANMVRDVQTLSDELELDLANTQALADICKDFPLRVPRPYLKRIEKNNLNDPLLLQILPQTQELIEQAGFTSDPLEEKQFSPVNGLLHKYHGRVLVVLNGNCAIHCRYCFRRHFPYSEHQLNSQQWQNILEYVRNDNSIEEVILSGGDPLSNTDQHLQKYIDDLEAIDHIKRLRIHTRLPVVIPQRITNQLIEMLSNSRLNCSIVIHANHAQEIDHEVQHYLQKLTAAGIVLFNQSVLLKNINDSEDALINLSKTLFACKVIPYYLHQLDAVQGAAHFDVSLSKAKSLHKKLQEKLSGYLVPKLVIEQAHAKHKTSIYQL